MIKIISIILFALLASCATNSSRLPEESNTIAFIDNHASVICGEMLAPMQAELENAHTQKKFTNEEFNSLNIEKAEMGVVMTKSACSCSIREAKTDYSKVKKIPSVLELKRKVFNLSENCKVSAVVDSGFVDLHRDGLIKSCYMKDDPATKLLVLKYGDLMPFKFKQFDIAKLRDSYPHRISSCTCYETYLYEQSNIDLWADSKVLGINEAERQLAKCEQSSKKDITSGAADTP